MRRAASRSLFDLAPDGVYPAPSVTLGAVGSYPTFSPLPRRIGAVHFLRHFPSPAISHRRSRVNHGTSCPAESGLSSLRRSEERPIHSACKWRKIRGRCTGVERFYRFRNRRGAILPVPQSCTIMVSQEYCGPQKQLQPRVYDVLPGPSEYRQSGWSEPHRRR